MQLINSPVTHFNLNQRMIYVKRDELLSSDFSGNKARKLAYFLTNPPSNIETLISYGGTQSNLMYSLSYLAKLNNWQFIYYVRTLSEQARATSNGNLAASLANGMNLIELKEEFYSTTTSLVADPEQLIITQGGAQAEAEFGLSQLAHEIKTWAHQQDLADLAIFVASGTGATAFYLQQHLPVFTVYTTNCVGTPEYLTSEFENLATEKEIEYKYPVILPNHSYRFATPHTQLYATIKDIQQLSNIEFDLVYDPVGWDILLANLPAIRQPTLYLHCGGLQGNLTMENRYKHLFKHLQ